MKALCIAIFATFIFALLIIYHDSQRAKALNNVRINDNVKIIICNGKVLRISQ